MITKSDHMLEKLGSHDDAAAITKWLAAYDARKGLLLVGDPESKVFSITSESIVSDEGQGKKVAWAVKKAGQTIGVMWIAREDTDDVQAPSVHMILNDSDDVAQAVLKDAIRYAYCNLPFATLYTRHDSDSASTIDKKLGFEKDGDAYDDERGQKWQNVALVL